MHLNVFVLTKQLNCTINCTLQPFICLLAVGPWLLGALCTAHTYLRYFGILK